MGDVKSMQFLGTGASFFPLTLWIWLYSMLTEATEWFMLEHKSLPWVRALTRPQTSGSPSGCHEHSTVLQQILTNEHNQFCCDSILLKPRYRLPHQKLAQSCPFASLYSKLSPFLGYGMPSICKYCGFMEDSLCFGVGGHSRYSLPWMPVHIANKEVLFHHHPLPALPIFYSFRAESWLCRSCSTFGCLYPGTVNTKPSRNMDPSSSGICYKLLPGC